MIHYAKAKIVCRKNLCPIFDTVLVRFWPIFETDLLEYAPSLEQDQWCFAPSLETFYNFVAENQ